MLESAKSVMTLLGTGTSMGVPMIGCRCPVCTSTNPRNQRTRTGVYIRSPGGPLLIDTSPELRLQLVREQIDMVHAVVYTHGHADHILGLDDLRIFGYKLKQPIPLYCEPAVEQHLRQTFAYAFTPPEERLHQHSTPDLVFRSIGEDPFELLGLTFTPLRLIHGQLPVLGYRIHDVAFCTDVSFIPESTWPLLQGLKTLVIDALWDDPHPTHFSVGQALEVIEKLQPERAFLTHCSHRLDYEKTNARLPPGVELAYDGLQIEL